MAFKYKIAGPVIWDRAKGGDGVRRNIGEEIPQEMLKDADFIEQLLKERRIVMIDTESGKKIESAYDYNTLSDEDINFLSSQNSFKMVNDAVVMKKYNPDALRKLKAACMANPKFENREILANTIDLKIKEIESQLHKESTNEQKTKNSNNK